MILHCLDGYLKVPKASVIPILECLFGAYDLGHNNGHVESWGAMVPCILNDDTSRWFVGPHGFKSKWSWSGQYGRAGVDEKRTMVQLSGEIKLLLGILIAIDYWKIPDRVFHRC